MKVIDRKDAINRRIYNHQSFVETAIYRVSSLNRTVLASLVMKVAERYPVLPCPCCSDRLLRHPIWVEYNMKD
ncbi:hypothetical protein [Nostoc punctiforme]|jgi:hypothetical protein|uniref:hypothetical protein n=1 Tax=Nostoc punctiforme TaxID=272131 RepID=UPI000045BE09|nr:hypothetical protein [Nostoc punctiforme]